LSFSITIRFFISGELKRLEEFFILVTKGRIERFSWPKLSILDWRSALLERISRRLFCDFSCRYLDNDGFLKSPSISNVFFRKSCAETMARFSAVIVFPSPSIELVMAKIVRDFSALS